MNNQRYFERHIYEMATNEFFRFKVTDIHGLSFMIVIHRRKSLIDLYEEVDLRMNGTTGEEYVRLAGIRNDSTTEIEFGRDTLHDVIENMIDEDKIIEIDREPSVLEIHLLHGD